MASRILLFTLLLLFAVMSGPAAAVGEPIRVHQNVKPSLGFLRDSTFADHMILVGTSIRLGAS